jgi:hypothetical protein
LRPYIEMSERAAGMRVTGQQLKDEGWGGGGRGTIGTLWRCMKFRPLF